MFKPLKEHSPGSINELPNQNLMPFGQGVHELWLDIQTDGQRNKNWYFSQKREVWKINILK